MNELVTDYRNSGKTEHKTFAYVLVVSCRNGRRTGGVDFGQKGSR